MIIIEQTLGNSEDPEWKARLVGATLDILDIDQWEAQKSRYRKTTANDVEIAISLDRGSHVHDGDVLHWDALATTAIVARIAMRDIMIVDLGALMHETPEIAMRTCVELGHAMGNQHWPALVKGSLIYVPLVLDRRVMDSVMRTHRFEGIRYEFVQGREVIPFLAPHETRRLFGAAEGSAHAHTHERYSAFESETGRVHGRPPVRDRQQPAHEHQHEPAPWKQSL